MHLSQFWSYRDLSRAALVHVEMHIRGKLRNVHISLPPERSANSFSEYHQLRLHDPQPSSKRWVGAQRTRRLRRLPPRNILRLIVPVLRIRSTTPRKAPYSKARQRYQTRIGLHPPSAARHLRYIPRNPLTVYQTSISQPTSTQDTFLTHSRRVARRMRQVCVIGTVLTKFVTDHTTALRTGPIIQLRFGFPIRHSHRGNLLPFDSAAHLTLPTTASVWLQWRNSICESIRRISRAQHSAQSSVKEPIRQLALPIPSNILGRASRLWGLSRRPIDVSNIVIYFVSPCFSSFSRFSLLLFRISCTLM
jgi:hypothetical protein